MLNIQKSFINDNIKNDPKAFVLDCENSYNQGIHSVALDIIKRKSQIVLVSGPSSSGKTTTSNRLRQYLLENNMKSYVISMDDYYLDIGSYELPVDENGKRDYESPLCMDLSLLSENLHDLVHGKEVLIPHYDFMVKKRSDKVQKLSLDDNTVILIEGIHALNPALTGVTDGYASKIYLRPEVCVFDNDKLMLRPYMSRFLRRVCRDRLFRSTSFEVTIDMWPSVRRGENLYIKPFRESADYQINTYLPYETAVFTNHLKDELLAHKDMLINYDLREIVELLGQFETIDFEKYMPENSLLHEFLG